MAYKISDTAIIIESGGESILVAESFQYENSITILDSDYTLSPDYITDYFTTPYVFQGSTSGYNAGGGFPVATQGSIIDKYSFATDANATDVGDLSLIKWVAAGQSSNANGYASGGTANPGQGYGPGANPATVGEIDKYPFASDGNATDIADLYARINSAVGQSSADNGYVSGGTTTNPAPGQVSTEPFTNNSNIIQKFPFASDTNGSNVGDLTEGRKKPAGQSSSTHGYNAGGLQPPLYLNTIDKFTFASDANATDVGDLTNGYFDAMGQSSSSSGYSSGGNTTPPFQLRDTIEKFPFATDANASNVGSLTSARDEAGTSSSTASGYTAGGRNPGYTNIIDKFPFASDGTASDVGDLTSNRAQIAGAQV